MAYQDEVIISIILGILAIPIIASNILTITAVCKFKSLRTIPNMYITNMACADLILGVTIPFGIARFFKWDDSIYSEKYSCLCILGLLTSLVAVSFVTLTCVSIDRFVAIHKPFIYKEYITGRVIFIVLLSVWIAGIADTCIVFFNNKWYKGVKCYMSKVADQTILSCSIAGIGLTCTVVITVLNVQILRTARRQQNQIKSLIICSDKERKASRQNTAEMIRFIITILTVFGILLICYMPSFLAILVHALSTNESILSDIGMNYCFILMFVNGFCNSLIYGWRMKAFRKAYLSLIHCGKYSNQNNA